MIKRQYRRNVKGYFCNFINSHDGEAIVEDALKTYNATIAKSKNRYHIMNVKWHDENMYALFVLRWAE